MSEQTDGGKLVELAACPFCGDEAQVATVHGGGIEWAQVECVNCECGAVGPTPAAEPLAVVLWNTRTPSPDLKADNAALVALRMVEDAMMRKDGEIVGHGWSITKLNEARPFIHAALRESGHE